MALFTREVIQGMYSGLANPEISYLADKIVPATPGPQHGVIPTDDFLADALKYVSGLDVGPAGAAKQLDGLASVPVNYDTMAYALKDLVPYDAEAYNQNRSISEANRALFRLRDALLLGREVRLRDLILNGTWNALSGAVAGGNQWDTATGDPMAQLLAAHNAIPGGANLIVMGVNSFAKFQTNPNSRGYLPNDSFRLLGVEAAQEVIRSVFGTDVNLYVPRAAYGAAGTFVWDDDVFVARIAGAGSQGVGVKVHVNPTAIARIESLPMTPTSEHVMDAGGRGGELIRLAHEEAIVQVTPALGVLYTSVNG